MYNKDFVYKYCAKILYDVHLTDRELEVLELVGCGYSNTFIKNKLVVSTRTVDRHISNILAKFSLTETNELRQKFSGRAVLVNIYFELKNKVNEINEKTALFTQTENSKTPKIFHFR